MSTVATDTVSSVDAEAQVAVAQAEDLIHENKVRPVAPVVRRAESAAKIADRRLNAAERNLQFYASQMLDEDCSALADQLASAIGMMAQAKPDYRQIAEEATKVASGIAAARLRLPAVRACRVAVLDLRPQIANMSSKIAAKAELMEEVDALMNEIKAPPSQKRAGEIIDRCRELRQQAFEARAAAVRVTGHVHTEPTKVVTVEPTPVVARDPMEEAFKEAAFQERLKNQSK